MIDTLDRPDFYYDFRPDKSFISSTEGTGTYEVTRDSLFIQRDRHVSDGTRSKYTISGNDLKIIEGNSGLNFKRL